MSSKLLECYKRADHYTVQIEDVKSRKWKTTEERFSNIKLLAHLLLEKHEFIDKCMKSFE